MVRSVGGEGAFATDEVVESSSYEGECLGTFNDLGDVAVRHLGGGVAAAELHRCVAKSAGRAASRPATNNAIAAPIPMTANARLATSAMIRSSLPSLFDVDCWPQITPITVSFEATGMVTTTALASSSVAICLGTDRCLPRARP